MYPCRKLILAALIGLVGLAADSRAGSITGITVTGPGGTATTSIESSDPSTALFMATFTSLAPIDFQVVVDGPGLYFLSFVVPPGSVTNATGETITAVEFTLLNGPQGSYMNQGQSNTTLPLPNGSFVGSNFRISGPPNLLPGGTAAIGAGFTIEGAGGPLTFTARLTPYGATAAIPEPASLLTAGAGLACLAGVGIARRRALPN